MSNSRIALFGLVCLLVNACTVVLQPAPPVTEPEARVGTVDPEPTVRPPVQQPRRRPANPNPSPGSVEPESDVSVADPEPTLRRPVQQPRRRPANPDASPGNVEPESPSQRPTPRTNGINLGIPPGHLPRSGECRVWVQGRPPGLQPRARTCHGILATAPVGSWILYSPAQYERQVRVRYLHAAQQRIVAVRAFDAETGAYLRDFALAEDDDNMDPRATGVNRPTVGPNGRPTDNQGNDGNSPGRSGNARDGEKTTSNNGVAVGRADSTRTNRPTVGSAGPPTSNRGNSGNRGTENRSTNGADKPTNPNRDISVVAADTTGNGEVAGNGGGIRARQTDTSDNRRARRGNIATAVGQVESSSEERAIKGTAQVPVQSGVRGGAVTGDNGVVTGEPPTNDVADPVSRRSERENRQPTSSLGSPLGIDARHFPRLGKCRVWVPGLPVGRQARPANCDSIVNDAPVGALILRRPAAQPGVLLVDYMHAERTGLVARTSFFDPVTGAALHSARLEPR